MRTLRSLLVFLIGLFLVTVGFTAGAQEESIFYGEIIVRPDWLYLAPSYQAEKLENVLLYQNTGPQDRLSDRSTIMVGDQYRFRIINDEWAQILPDEGATDPFTHELDSHVYLPSSQIRWLEPEEFAPIVLSSSAISSRLIVIIRDEYPDMVVFDEIDGKPEVVLRTPIIVGRGSPEASLTPLGDYRIYLTKAADNMTSFTGVPWTMYFTGDKALHEFHGWNWGYLTQGGYGSQGCVNVPDEHWFNINVNGSDISAAHWLYRWTSVPAIDYDEFDSAQFQGFLDSNDPGWYSASSTVRVLVVSSFWDIYSYVSPARLDPNSEYASWSLYEEAYEEILGNWVLPHSVGGNLNLQLVPQEQVPAAGGLS